MFFTSSVFSPRFKVFLGNMSLMSRPTILLMIWSNVISAIGVTSPIDWPIAQDDDAICDLLDLLHLVRDVAHANTVLFELAR